MATCPNCQAPNRDNAKFCVRCGKPLGALSGSAQPVVQPAPQPSGMAAPPQAVPPAPGGRVPAPVQANAISGTHAGPNRGRLYVLIGGVIFLIGLVCAVALTVGLLRGNAFLGLDLPFGKTATPTGTATATITQTVTFTPVPSRTSTVTPSPSATPAPPTDTPTPPPSPSATKEPTRTSFPSPTPGTAPATHTSTPTSTVQAHARRADKSASAFLSNIKNGMVQDEPENEIVHRNGPGQNYAGLGILSRRGLTYACCHI